MTAVVLKQNKSPARSDSNAPAIGIAPPTSAPVANAKLPKLMDLGAGKCIPRRMMEPILDERKRDYASQFITEFIDVGENPDEGKKPGVEVIPT